MIWCSKRARRWNHNFWLHCQQIWSWNGRFTGTICNAFNGMEFTIASTSIIKVFRASSFKLDPWVLSSDTNTALADLIWCSQVPPKWLPAGGFSFQIIRSLPKFCKNPLILFWSVSRKPELLNWNFWVDPQPWENHYHLKTGQDHKSGLPLSQYSDHYYWDFTCVPSL